MEYIGVYESEVAPEICNGAIETIEEILSRPDPGSGVLGRNIFIGKYGSLKKFEDAIMEHVWSAWYNYNKLHKATTRKFPEIFDYRWCFKKIPVATNDDTKWRSDQRSGGDRDRFASWILFLNEPGGGSVEFKDKQIIYPETGKLLIFPSSYTHQFRHNDVSSDYKYIARGWFKYPKRTETR